MTPESTCWVATTSAVCLKHRAMHRIPDIDRQITQLLQPVPAIAAAIQMPVICGLEDEAAVERETSFPGLYRIDVSTVGHQGDLVQWLASFKADWECDSAKGGKGSALIKKRLLQHKTLQEWMPVYVGKSRNVAERVASHIHLPFSSSTYGLKLKARPGLALRAFRLHAIELKVVNYDVLAPALESALRERFHPLIGRQ